MGIWSTQAKVEDIVLKTAWHWGSDGNVVNDSLWGTRPHPKYVGLPSAWGLVEGDCRFSPSSIGELF